MSRFRNQNTILNYSFFDGRQIQRLKVSGSDGELRLDADGDLSISGKPRCSVSILSNSPSSGSNVNPFLGPGYSSFVEGEDWRYDIPSVNAEYESDLGRFHPLKDGLYQISFGVCFTQSSTGLAVLELRVTGSRIWANRPLVDSTSDPVFFSFSTFQSLLSGNYVDFLIHPGAGTIKCVSSSLNLSKFV